MKSSSSYSIFLLFAVNIFSQVDSRIHRLTIEDDARSTIRLTNFGFYKQGYLYISLRKFSFASLAEDNNKSPVKDVLFGFTLEKVQNDAVDPRLEVHREECLLKDADTAMRNNEKVVFFTMDRENLRLNINCSAQSDVGKITIYEKREQLPITSIKNGKKYGNSNDKNLRTSSCVNFSLPIELDDCSGTKCYKTQFVVYIPTEKEEGLYELFFHNCANYKNTLISTSFQMYIEEYNVDNYLSAGEMPLPALYFMMSIIFFLSAVFWVYILVTSRHPVFKIHHLMATLVLLKSLGLLFHSINYYYIETQGEHVVTWAVLYYVTHLLRGSVLFITIIIIGTGWTFIKHILSPKDKKIFMIVIPLQVFANIAEIILEESEEGDATHETWRYIFTFVDLICCFIILFPIVWSIKHLEDASHTDGKAAMNLEKLKLFRHFYIMIVCYIYFTRMIVYLLRQTVEFRYLWLDEMFRELATFVFFVVTGYKFRPASANPYFQHNEDDDTDMDIIVSQCGFTEGLTKLNRISNEAGEHDKDTLLIYKRESSYDYD
ncbi:protein GPR107 [Planococcus citri]|uniref:protein GPR107 n=1 Tax=Planococcus citri TaxID=170843 RepID=UPI0031F8F1A7